MGMDDVERAGAALLPPQLLPCVECQREGSASCRKSQKPAWGPRRTEQRGKGWDQVEKGEEQGEFKLQTFLVQGTGLLPPAPPPGAA